MKSLVVSLFVVWFLLGLPLLASAQEVKQGDQATVPNEEVVDVKNPSEIGSLSYGDSCIIKRGGRLTVVGMAVDINGPRLLVRYMLSDGKRNAAECPTGILFFISKQKFSEMSAEYQKIQEAEAREKVIVDLLLKEER